VNVEATKVGGGYDRPLLCASRDCRAKPVDNNGRFGDQLASTIHPHGEPTAHEILEARRLALSVLPIGLTSFGRATGPESEASDFALAQFEDLRAAVQESRVSPGFVNGPCFDRHLASTLLPHKIVSSWRRRES